MKIKTDFTTIPDLYSKKTDVLVQGNAVVSFPFSIEDAPKETKSFAWSFIDDDSIPVCGFAYIHWVVANVTADKLSIEADYSRLDNNHLKGKNSLVSAFLPTDYSEIENDYIGPYPPDKDHDYTLTVYALDCQLDLAEGFYLNEMKHAMEGHILATASIDLIGEC